MPKENSSRCQRSCLYWWALRLGMFALAAIAGGHCFGLIFETYFNGFQNLATTCNLLFTHYDRVFQTQLRPPIGKQFCSTGIYQFEYGDEVHQGPGPKTWKDVAALPCKYINLGADGDRHTTSGATKYRHYLNYVAVQGSSRTEGWGCSFNFTSQQEECGPWCVCHDLREAIPLPNSSVDRFHSEDFFEHIDHWHYAALFKELHRLLKPGGRARIAVPDYSTPNSYSGKHPEAWRRHEDTLPDGAHRTLTNYALIKKYVEGSPFKKADWLLYYDNTVPGEKMSSRHLPEGGFRNSEEHPLPYIRKPINYTLGTVRRTPDVDCRNNFLKGSPVTSVVFDLVKDPVPLV